jgi:hypothetical protein
MATVSLQYPNLQGMPKSWPTRLTVAVPKRLRGSLPIFMHRVARAEVMARSTDETFGRPSVNIWTRRSPGRFLAAMVELESNPDTAFILEPHLKVMKRDPDGLLGPGFTRRIACEYFDHLLERGVHLMRSDEWNHGTVTEATAQRIRSTVRAADEGARILATEARNAGAPLLGGIIRIMAGVVSWRLGEDAEAISHIANAVQGVLSRPRGVDAMATSRTMEASGALAIIAETSGDVLSLSRAGEALVAMAYNMARQYLKAARKTYLDTHPQVGHLEERYSYEWPSWQRSPRRMMTVDPFQGYVEHHLVGDTTLRQLDAMAHRLETKRQQHAE